MGNIATDEGQAGGIVARGTVVLGANGQAITIPVTSGNGAGLIRCAGLLLCPATQLALKVLVNGLATNVTHQNVNGRAGAAAADAAQIGIEDLYGAFIEFSFLTSVRGAALRRGGNFQVASVSTSATGAYKGGVIYNDTTTLITSLAIDCGNATGLLQNSYLYYEEIAI